MEDFDIKDLIDKPNKDVLDTLAKLFNNSNNIKGIIVSYYTFDGEIYRAIAGDINKDEEIIMGDALLYDRNRGILCEKDDSERKC